MTIFGLMVAVITGDIIHSRVVKDPRVWMDPLKELFCETGESPKNWLIYRGDSFQIEVPAEEAFLFAIRIKAIVKSVKPLDVRMAIGMGNKTYDAPNVSESAGDAFLFSGETFDLLDKKSSHIRFKSNWKEFDEEVNILLTLLSVVLDDWSTTSAHTAELVLRDRGRTQNELADILGISQSSVSARYNRAHLNEITELLDFLKKRTEKHLRTS